MAQVKEGKCPKCGERVVIVQYKGKPSPTTHGCPFCGYRIPHNKFHIGKVS